MTSCFFGQPEYDYTIVTPPADEVCMICLEKYTTEQAIRLTHCGHLIGSECFRDWISCHPETCTYWNHPLPLSDARDPSFVERFCAEQESEYMELMWYSLEGLPGSTMRFRSCLRALWDDPFTFANAAEFMFFHGPMILALSVIMIADIFYLFLAVVVTAVKFFLSFEVSSITLIKADIVATIKTTVRNLVFRGVARITHSIVSLSAAS